MFQALKTLQNAWKTARKTRQTVQQAKQAADAVKQPGGKGKLALQAAGLAAQLAASKAFAALAASGVGTPAAVLIAAVVAVGLVLMAVLTVFGIIIVMGMLSGLDEETLRNLEGSLSGLNPLTESGQETLAAAEVDFSQEAQVIDGRAYALPGHPARSLNRNHGWGVYGWNETVNKHTNKSYTKGVDIRLADLLWAAHEHGWVLKGHFYIAGHSIGVKGGSSYSHHIYGRAIDIHSVAHSTSGYCAGGGTIPETADENIDFTKFPAAAGRPDGCVHLFIKWLFCSKDLNSGRPSRKGNEINVGWHHLAYLRDGRAVDCPDGRTKRLKQGDGYFQNKGHNAHIHVAFCGWRSMSGVFVDDCCYFGVSELSRKGCGRTYGSIEIEPTNIPGAPAEVPTYLQQ